MRLRFVLRRGLALVAALVVAQLALACGLVDGTIDDIRFALPTKSFTLDTTDYALALDADSAPNVPSIACEGDCEGREADLCDAAGACTASCVDRLCSATVRLVLAQRFDLDAEVDQLVGRAADQLDISIERITFVVTDNTFNVATPPVNVWMAPGSVMSPTNVEARLLGTIEPIPARQKGTRTLTLAAGGDEAFQDFVEDFRSPFNVLVEVEATVHAGDPVPIGRMMGQVEAVLTASLL